MNCKYLFKVGNNTVGFNSEEELSSFITNNANRLKVKNNSAINYSKEFKKQDETYAKLINIRDSIAKLDVSYDEFGNKLINHSDYISVTKAITDPSFVGNDRAALVTAFNVDEFLSKEKERMSKTKKQDGTSYTDQELDDYLLNLTNNWKKLAKIGTAIHAIAEIAFTDLNLSDQEIIDKFKTTREYKDVNFGLNEMTAALEYIKNVKENLLRRFPNAKFIPELKIRTADGSPKKVVGKIDLLVVDEQGDVHVFDFKASPKNYENFKQVKEITFEYQLAFYKQMLSQHGVNVSRTQLGILPIQLTDIDYENNTFNEISAKADIKILDLNRSSKYYITRNIQDLLPSKEISYQVSTNDYDRLEKISNEVFGYNLEEKGMRKSNAKPFQRNDGTWGFKDPYTGKIYNAKTEAEITKDFEEYLKRSKENKLYYAQEVAVEFNAARANNENAFDIGQGKSRKYNYYFAKYLKEGYQLNTSLLGMGVLMFTHPTYKVVDFVYINNEDISKPIDTLAFGKNGSKITGNLIHDKDADTDTMDANVGNLELMRLMFAANEIMPQFSDYSVQEFKVINNNGRKMAFQNTDMLLKNFNQLVNLAKTKKPELKIENNFTKMAGGRNVIEVIKPEVRLLNAIDEILNREPNASERFLGVVKGNLKGIHMLSDEAKLQKLIEVSQQIRDQVIGNSEFSENTILEPLKDMENNRLAALYYLVHDVIRETGNLYFEYQFADISNWSAHNELFSPAQLSAIKVINEVQKKIIDKAREKSIKEMNEKFTPIKVYSEKYLQETNSIDSSLNAFDSIIEQSDEMDNKFFKVKNPYSDLMSPTHKEFLTEWLKTINSIRYPATKGDHTSPEAQDLIRTGEWFNIPLMRGGIYNRGVRGVFDNVKDLLDKVKNPLETLSALQEENKNKQLDRFDLYINPLKIDGEDRDNLLNSKDVNYFSRNLSEIALEYQYQAVLEKNYNEALPYIRTGLICANAVNLFTKSELDDAMKLMYEKYQSAFYNVNHIPAKAMPFYQGYMVLSNLANVFTLALNPVSFVREMLTGRYNNFGRLLTRFAGKDMPSEADLVKAYTVVDASGVGAMFKQNLMNGFNMRFNIGGRAMSEMKESHRAQRNPLLGIFFKSGSLFTMNQLPDYEHRMALFMAYLYKDGCMDAYSYDENTQKLIYNFDKDPRFKCVSEYIKTGKASEEDMKNIAKYQMMLEEFNKDLPTGSKLKFGDPLPDGITESRVKTIKNISNQIHGNMDSDTAMHARRYIWGKVFLKFQTFISAKVLNYTLTPGKYQLMEEVHAKDPETGLPLYLKMVKDPTTGEITMEETTDYDDPMCTKQPVIKMMERQEAGIIYGLRDILDILSDPENRAEKWKTLQEDEAKMAGLKFMIGDLFMLLIASIMGMAMNIPELKQDSPLTADSLNAILNTTRENNPIVLMSGVLSVIDPSAFNINKKVVGNTVNFITNDNYESKDYLYRTFGFGKLFFGIF